MLAISRETLPRTDLAYAAFRLACMETLQVIDFCRFMPEMADGCYGFLGEVPFLREVSPRVQIELLAGTWSKHVSHEVFEATLIDESIVYSVCETATRIVREETGSAHSFLRGGPRRLSIDGGSYCAVRFQALHLDLPNEGDFLLLGQFLDMAPAAATEWKRHYGLNEDELDQLFELLARWHPSADVATKLEGLLTPQEITQRLPLLLPDRLDSAQI